MTPASSPICLESILVDAALEPALGDALVDGQSGDRGLGELLRSKTRRRHDHTILEPALAAQLTAALGGRGDRVEERRAHGATLERRAAPPPSCPPGEVTWARSTSGNSPVVAQQRRRSVEGVDHEAGAPRRAARPWCTPASMSASTTR